MRVLVLLFCVVLTARFVYNLQRITNRDGWKWFIKTMLDAFLIIAFAIIEKGRW